MSDVVSFFTWRVRVINLLQEAAYPSTRLTSVSAAQMQESYDRGETPEKFVESLSRESFALQSISSPLSPSREPNQ